MSEKLVCVTGGSGYIASWLVKLLLQRGYTVRASVRDPSDPNKTEHLRALDGASERLHLYKANLLEEGSFDAAIAGCVGVFHTASPCLLNVNETNFQAELIDPAVKGTLNVLRSCVKASSVKRVVMTSSMASINYNERAQSPDVVVDETWFSDPDFCVRSKLWYQLSKILAEEAACKFSKQTGVELVTINPGLVIGPLLQPTLNLSPSFIYNLINEVVQIIRKLYPSIPVPEKCADDKPFETVYQVSKEKARSLGLNFTPLEQSVKETIESLKEKFFIIF
ncbi:phenylacetaldehyde reductase-like isoform X2 [Carex rostrata]